MTWGTIEEKYRMLCLKLAVSRYAYYVLAVPVMSDEEYDRLEDGLKKFEEAMPHLVHPRSPTKVPGSDQPSSYPQSVRYYCENFLPGGRKLSRQACMGRDEIPND